MPKIIRTRMIQAFLLLTLLSTMSACVAPGQRFRFHSVGLDVREESESGKRASVAYELVRVDSEVVQKRQRGLNSIVRGYVSQLPEYNEQDVRDDPYILGVGDVIRIDVWGFPRLGDAQVGIGEGSSVSKVIDSAGQIFFPYIGTLDVGGSTVKQARLAITQKLANTLIDPQVDVVITEYRSKWVSVLGEVGNPGRYSVASTRKRLVEFIGAAGGFSTARQDKGDSRAPPMLFLIRDGVVQLLPIDDSLSSVVDTSRAMQLPLQDKDVVYVPSVSENQAYVLGAIRRQSAAVPVDSLMGVSLQEVLNAAGGLNQSSSDASAVYIASAWTDQYAAGQWKTGAVASNYDSSGPIPYTVYRINIGNPQGVLLAQQFPVAGGDLIYVGNTHISRFNAVIAQLLPSANTLFRYDRVLDRFED